MPVMAGIGMQPYTEPVGTYIANSQVAAKANELYPGYLGWSSRTRGSRHCQTGRGQPEEVSAISPRPLYLRFDAVISTTWSDAGRCPSSMPLQ